MGVVIGDVLLGRAADGVVMLQNAHFFTKDCDVTLRTWWLGQRTLIDEQRKFL